MSVLEFLREGFARCGGVKFAPKEFERYMNYANMMIACKKLVLARENKTDPDYQNLQAYLRDQERTFDRVKHAFDRLKPGPKPKVESYESMDDSDESTDESERSDEISAFKELLFGGMNQTNPGNEYHLQARLGHEEPRPEPMVEFYESTDESDESTDESERSDEPANSPTTSRTTTRGAAAGGGATAGGGAAAGGGATASKKTHKCTKCKKKFHDKVGRFQS